MESQKKTPSNSPHDPSAFAAWGGLTGGAVGLIIGLLLKNWILWTGLLAIAGWLVGGIVDRSRR